jgi:hypothetical protein
MQKPLGTSRSVWRTAIERAIGVCLPRSNDFFDLRGKPLLGPLGLFVLLLSVLGGVKGPTTAVPNKYGVDVSHRRNLLFSHLRSAAINRQHVFRRHVGLEQVRRA